MMCEKYANAEERQRLRWLYASRALLLSFAVIVLVLIAFGLTR
jgi:hypothetical protein